MKAQQDREVLPTRWGAVVIAILGSSLVGWPEALLLEGASFLVGGPAMEPTYRNDQRCFMDKTAYALHWDLTSPLFIELPRLGDVVVADGPEGVAILKRVVGLPGDVIEMQGGRLVRNGEVASLTRVRECDASFIRDSGTGCAVYEERLEDASYRVAFDGHFDDDSPPTTVPPDHVYLLGDRRDRSNDSRNPVIGPVQATSLRGRVVACLSGGGSNAE